MSEQKKRLHMAHNIYSNPVLNGTGRKFDGFSIDFRGIQTPRATYWALCNWGMNLSGASRRQGWRSLCRNAEYLQRQNRNHGLLGDLL